jgi:glycine cleavage system H lipoate-binding protein
MNSDIFATKGTEYLIVIAYLTAMAWAVRWFGSRPVAAAPTSGARRRGGGPAAWFALTDGYHFHPGHAWAAPTDGDIVTVGLDDFAATLVGPPDGIELPAVGADVRQGEPGWSVQAGDRTLTMLSPIEGQVVAVNQSVLETPRLAADDPYGQGWLLKVRAPNRKASLKNLLSGELASVWMRLATDRLQRLPAAGLGVVMADGGTPVRGFGRALGPDEWQAVARDFFLTG